MYKLYTKKEYKYTKKLLKMFIKIIREQNKEYSLDKAKLLNSGYTQQIKEFVMQLREYRRKKRVRSK